MKFICESCGVQTSSRAKKAPTLCTRCAQEELPPELLGLLPGAPLKPTFHIAIISEDPSVGVSIAASMTALCAQKLLCIKVSASKIKSEQKPLRDQSDIQLQSSLVNAESETQRYILHSSRQLLDALLALTTNKPEAFHGLLWIVRRSDQSSHVLPLLGGLSQARSLPLVVILSEDADDASLDALESSLREDLSLRSINADEVSFLRVPLARLTEEPALLGPVLAALDTFVALRPTHPRMIVAPIIAWRTSPPSIEVSSKSDVFEPGMSLEVIGFGEQHLIEVTAEPVRKGATTTLSIKSPVKVQPGQLLSTPSVVRHSAQFRAVLCLLPPEKPALIAPLFLERWQRPFATGIVEMLFYTRDIVDPNRLLIAAGRGVTAPLSFYQQCCQVSGRIQLLSALPAAVFSGVSVEVEVTMSYPMALREGFFFSLAFADCFDDSSRVGAIGFVTRLC